VRRWTVRGRRFAGSERHGRHGGPRASGVSFGPRVARDVVAGWAASAACCHGERRPRRRHGDLRALGSLFGCPRRHRRAARTEARGRVGRLLFTGTRTAAGAREGNGLRASSSGAPRRHPRAAWTEARAGPRRPSLSRATSTGLLVRVSPVPTCRAGLPGAGWAASLGGTETADTPWRATDAVSCSGVAGTDVSRGTSWRGLGRVARGDRDRGQRHGGPRTPCLLLGCRQCRRVARDFLARTGPRRPAAVGEQRPPPPPSRAAGAGLPGRASARGRRELLYGARFWGAELGRRWAATPRGPEETPARAPTGRPRAPTDSWRDGEGAPAGEGRARGWCLPALSSPRKAVSLPGARVAEARRRLAPRRPWLRLSRVLGVRRKSSSGVPRETAARAAERRPDSATAGGTSSPTWARTPIASHMGKPHPGLTSLHGSPKSAPATRGTEGPPLSTPSLDAPKKYPFPRVRP
jgi:hypothetical protein